ncbi:MAG: hypothetical protein ACYC7E_02265 [Armatimonadota bacterium]
MRNQISWLILLGLALPALAAGPIQLGISVKPGNRAQGTSLTTQRIAEGTVRYVAIRATWPRLQPLPSRWDFSWLDTAVNAALARKQQVVLVLGPSPRWAVTYLNNPTAEQVLRSKPTPKALAAYATAVAKRYGNRVRYYQLWERPESGTLLAVPRDVHLLFRTAAKAIHTFNPSLKVIVPEPGDVDLRWMAQYLSVAQAGERPDVFLLSPDRQCAIPQRLAWRLQVLRGRILPAKNPPALWASIPVTPKNSQHWNLAASALLQDISTLLFTGNESCIQTVKTELSNGLSRLVTLVDTTYSGSCRLSPEVVAGLFTRGKDPTVLALPQGDASLQLIAATEPEIGHVAVPAGKITPISLQGSMNEIHIKQTTVLPLNGEPILLRAATIRLEAKILPASPQRVEDDSVSLVADGSNPLALCPLPNLPGGGYTREPCNAGCLLVTRMEVAPWIHFNVPDGFLFYNTARIPVEVTVRVRGVWRAKKTGFYLYYDGIKGMASTDWQWIDTGYDQVFTYTFRINDALFADSEGYDLRLDMAGSVESIRLVDVAIQKLPNTSVVTTTSK